jgi:2-haloacid dehalogenase
MRAQRPVVTFDLFSALLDSRSGGAAAFAGVARARGWPVDGETIYHRWDALNKAAQRDCASWVPFRELARGALEAAYAALGVRGSAADDIDDLIESMPDWPLWPDVAEHLPRWADDGGVAGYRIGLLSNVDDDIFRSTRAATVVDPEVAMTSQRLGVYKPDQRIYTRARDQLGPGMVHVATSARDVRGALEAGCAMVRLRRPGHGLDPQAPAPPYEVDDVRDLPALLTEMAASPR